MYHILLLITGILHGFMLSLNAQLGEHFSMFGVTFIVHVVPMLLLLIYLLAIKRERLNFKGAPWYIYLVGLMGIAIVASSSIVTMKIGAGAMMAISTTGQIISSEAIDALGLFGMKRTLPNRRQLPGFLVMAAGVVLVILF